MENLSTVEKRVILELQEDIPLSYTPFLEIAQRVGIKEDQLIQLLKSFQERGLLRRIGAVLDHYKAGYNCNVMVAWRVNPRGIPDFVEIASKYPQLTHCYRRSAPAKFPYNVYTMIHGRCRSECELIVRELSALTSVTEYRAYYTKKQYKKTSMRYVKN